MIDSMWKLLGNFYLILILMVISYGIFEIIIRVHNFIKKNVLIYIVHKITLNIVETIFKIFLGIEWGICDRPEFNSEKIIVTLYDLSPKIIYKDFSMMYVYGGIKTASIAPAPDSIFYEMLNDLYEYLNGVGIIRSIFYFNKMKSHLAYYAGEYITMWLLDEKIITIENDTEVKFHGERVAFSADSAEKLSRLDKSPERENGIQTSKTEANGGIENNSHQDTQERN